MHISKLISSLNISKISFHKHLENEHPPLTPTKKKEIGFSKHLEN